MLNWINTPFLVHTVKSPILGQHFIACASNIFPPSPTHLYTSILFHLYSDSVLPLSFFQHYPLFASLGQRFPPKNIGACSFLWTIILFNCSTFLRSRISGETAGKTRPFETTIQKKERKTVQVGEVNGTHTLVWECRWADNACCKKLETVKLVDGRIRLDE